jgi:glyoxylase-like metal-dependent hydrolase (beta-lactamase superfamily II)
LIDTLFDVPMTRRMLTAFERLTAVSPIGRLVNTHGNGDHWFGNQLLAHTEIIASHGTDQDMRQVGPRELEALLKGHDGVFAREIFGAFDFGGVEATYPTTLFDKTLTLDVGGVEVELIDVGPAHTAGDTIVHVPSARTVFTGDILFADSTPVMWHGPVRNWLKACDLLLGLDVDAIVPGHGPVATKESIREQAAYLAFVHQEASTRFTRGMSHQEAAHDIDLGRYAALPERERLAVNVHAVYRELDPTTPALTGPALFGCMGDLRSNDR